MKGPPPRYTVAIPGREDRTFETLEEATAYGETVGPSAGGYEIFDRHGHKRIRSVVWESAPYKRFGWDFIPYRVEWSDDKPGGDDDEHGESGA